MPRPAETSFLRLAVFGLMLGLLAPLAACASEPTPEQAEMFEKKIRPLLELHCYQCHSHKSGKSKGHLVVDSLGALLKGGDSGPALRPGQPGKSLLVKAIAYEDDELRMPPKGKLAEDQIALLRTWIEMGAPWPGSSSEKTVRSPGKITDADRRWWAFQPLKPVAPPKVVDPAWGANPVDHFIRQRLLAEGLQPAPRPIGPR